MDPETQRHGNELTSRLNERREKLNYFIVTASIAVVAFTLKNALDSRELFSGCRLALVVLGSILLLVAAGGSLWTVRTRHRQDWRFISLGVYGGDEDAANAAMEETRDQMKTGALLTFGAFIGGIGCLAGAYIWAIASGA